MSSVFLTQDTMHKCGTWCLVSVRLSVTFLYCIQMAKDTVKLLFLPGSPIILHS